MERLNIHYELLIMNCFNILQTNFELMNTYLATGRIPQDIAKK